MKKLSFMLLLLCGIILSAEAQSVSLAKRYIDEGRYTDAAKVLRQLVDERDADPEGQYLAATLFLEGKGLPKNEAQGLKYLKLSADQGYEDAINGLIGHYFKKERWTEAFNAASRYAARHPYMLNSSVGHALAICYLHGYGTKQDVDKAWSMINGNTMEDQFKEDNAKEWQAYLEAHPEFKVYDIVEQMPEWPGGTENLFQWIREHISNKGGSWGKVICAMTIERDGSVTGVKVVRREGTIYAEDERDIISTFKSMPKWIPGKQNGVAVRVKYMIPLNLR